MTEVIVNAEANDAPVIEAAETEGNSETSAEETEAVEEAKDEIEEAADEVEEAAEETEEAVEAVEDKLDEIEETLEDQGDNIDRLATVVGQLTQVVSGFMEYMETLTVEERTENDTPEPIVTEPTKTESEKAVNDNGNRAKRPVRRGYSGPIGRRR
jgi:chromosome segregation ATPase